MSPKSKSAKKSVRIYISGPMTGIKEYNYPLFYETARKLQQIYPNAEILNPAALLHGDTSFQRATYIREDIKYLLCATAVWTLPGWRQSKGAVLEMDIAMELGLEHINALEEPENILLEANGLINGNRAASYGHPLEDYTRVAKSFSALTGHDITPEEAVMFMILVKLSRETHGHKRDNLVDGAGYFGCLDKIHNKKALLESGY